MRGNQRLGDGLREKGKRSAPCRYAVTTLAPVLKMRKPVPSKSFINEPVTESRPSGKSTKRPPRCKYSAMCLTAKGEVISTGKVRRLTMTSLWNQLTSAVSPEVTNRQSSSRHTPINTQSHQD